MKLKSSFVSQDVDGSQFLVPVGEETFSGIVRSNETAAIIINLLREETSEEKISEALLEIYDAPYEQIAADVREVLSVLREIHALEE